MSKTHGRRGPQANTMWCEFGCLQPYTAVAGLVMSNDLLPTSTAMTRPNLGTNYLTSTQSNTQYSITTANNNLRHQQTKCSVDINKCAVCMNHHTRSLQKYHIINWQVDLVCNAHIRMQILVKKYIATTYLQKSALHSHVPSSCRSREDCYGSAWRWAHMHCRCPPSVGFHQTWCQSTA